MKNIAVLILSLVCVNIVFAQYDAIIAADGSGDFNSVQKAHDRVRSSASGRYLFYIKPGVYKEKIQLTRSNISLIGADRDNVIITWDDYSGDADGHSTSTSYTVEVGGDSFYAENITFENSAGKVGQAVAVSTIGKQQVFKNCRFTGFQDTYYAKKGIQYMLNCTFEGGTDFIFGESTCIFEDCDIVCVSGGQFITAPADTKLITQVNGGNFYHGLFFNNSRILPGDGVGADTYYLMRPWQPNSSTVFINCQYDNHIKPIGWSTWDNNNHLSGYYGEYGATDLNGNAVDVSQRADWSHQIPKDLVDNYYTYEYFYQGWDPKPLTAALDAPSNLTRNINKTDAFDFSWDNVPDALGYVIYKNNDTFGFSASNNFIDSVSSISDQYVVRSVSFSGALSAPSAAIQGMDVNKQILGLNKPISTNGSFLKAKQPFNVKLFNLSGKLLFEKDNLMEIDLRNLASGIVILQVENAQGFANSYRIAL